VANGNPTPAHRLRVNRVQRFCLHDGPGIRTTVFLQGCPLRCWWCHNPETLAADSPRASAVGPDALLADLARDAAYWAESGGGITLSGGEPLAQADAVAGLLQSAKDSGYHAAVDTSGAGAPDAVRRLAPHVALWLWDLKAVSPRLAAEGTGGDLRDSLDNLAWVLGETQTPVWLRLPLIRSFNTSEAELAAIGAWVAAQPRVPPVQVLPGHSHGAAKHEARDPDERIVPSPDDLDRAVRVLTGRGLHVTVAPQEPRTCAS